MRLSGWTNIRKPPSARYTSANFDPSLIIPESTPRLATASTQPLAGFTAAVPPPPAPAPQAEQRVASLAAPPAQGSAPPQGGPSIGSWVIQVGSFNDPQAAQLALERAASTLSDMHHMIVHSYNFNPAFNKRFDHRGHFIFQHGKITGYCSMVSASLESGPSIKSPKRANGHSMFF